MALALIVSAINAQGIRMQKQNSANEQLRDATKFATNTASENGIQENTGPFRAPDAIIYSEGFESTTGTPTQNSSTGAPTFTPPLPTGWTKSYTTGHGWGTASDLADVPGCGDDFAPHTGTRMMYNTWSSAGNKWAFSPEITLAAGTAYTVSFWYNAMGWDWEDGSPIEYDDFEVRIGTTATAAAMNTAQLVFSHIGIYYDFDFLWHQATYTFTPATAGTYYLGFHDLRPAQTGLCIMIDDIAIDGQGTNSVPVVNGNEINIFQNNGNINVLVSEKSDIRIFDMQGRVLGNYNVEANATLKVAQPAGMYLIEVRSGGAVSTHKVVVK